MSELEDFVCLNMVRGVGPVAYRELLRHFGSVDEILSAKLKQLESVPGIGRKTATSIARARSELDVPAEIALAEREGVAIVHCGDDRYPRNLKYTYDPPLALYVKGTLAESDALALAVIGSRRCSHYGRSQAEKLSYELAAAGFCVISGLARGVDGAAHRGALRAKGRTVAVLGCGLGTIYPPEHRKLSDQIAQQGALLAEFPMTVPPDGRNFPQRNRIISGLSLGVLVIEAALKSGALITTRWAMEQGREVYAVPGSIQSPLNRGSHRLIKDGAKLVEGIDDILEELGPLGESISTGQGEVVEDPRELNLTDREKQVFGLLSAEPRHIDEVIVESGLSAGIVSSTLLILEMKKLVKQLAGKVFVKA